MIYAKIFLFGIGGAIVAALFWIVVSFVLPIFMPVHRCGMVGLSSIQCGALSQASGSVGGRGRSSLRWHSSLLSE